MYLAGYGIFAIADHLTRDDIPCPSAYDPARNRHRTGQAWSKGAVKVILTNPRYTGHQTWNKQRTDEVLLDVNDVALGHTTVMRWNPTTSGSSARSPPTNRWSTRPPSTRSSRR
jgi:site-specific DNA recombinase